jgi:N6-L-threonylcarbamoyladenine synthase
MVTLAFETSCDETAVALVEDGRRVLAEALASQIPLQQRFGGVVPELASRAHLEALPGVLDTVFQESGLEWKEIDQVAATAGPGLQGSLIVGFQAAQALAWSKSLPFIPVNHLAGHLYANWLAYPEQKFTFPLLGLVVSGGHTIIIEMTGHHHFRLLGQTLDDAAGEAFDKVARLLGLPYPGGPEISRLAESGDPARFDLPRALTQASQLKERPYDLSFSGLKTAVRRLLPDVAEVSDNRSSGSNYADLAASFEEAVVEAIAIKLARAADAAPYQGILTGGGVVANRRLRERLEALAGERGLPLFVPPPALCTDNAAAIGAAAHFAPAAGPGSVPALVDPNLELAKP